MEPEKFLALFLTETASSRLSSETVWTSDPTGLAAILFQSSSVGRHQKTCSGDNPKQHSTRRSILDPTDVPKVSVRRTVKQPVLSAPRHGGYACRTIRSRNAEQVQGCFAIGRV